MRVCDVRNKQVINACDCKILGCVVDIDFEDNGDFGDESFDDTDDLD